MLVKRVERPAHLDDPNAFAEQEKTMTKQFLRSLMLSAALCCATSVLADSDATLPQVYEAANSGHLDQAQQMMAQVLRDHPESAKAHYVEAELDAKQHQFTAARTELGTAERLQPGLPFAKPESVRALQSELGFSSGSMVIAQPAQVNGGAAAAFPWGLALIVLGIIAVVWLFARSRRNAVPQYLPNSMTSANGMPSGYGAPGMGPNVGGGMGSGIVGGLASGLAVGAGVVAGEEIAHHFLDGNRRPEDMRFPDDDRRFEGDSNNAMGGSDFGVSDNGSWDDSSSSGDSGGGGDWG